MFIKVYFVYFSNYDNWYYKRRCWLPPGELEEYGEHQCAPTEAEVVWGRTLPCSWRVEVSMHCRYKDGAWEFGVSK